jgi:sedoheptulose-bisphosphatase
MELQAHLDTLFLPQAGSSDRRRALRTSVLPALLAAVAGIADTLRASQHVRPAGTANAFGDDQLNVDVAAEHCLRAELARCPAVATASSEEDPVERPVNPGSAGEEGQGQGQQEEEQYTVAFDPLDGSSIIAPNWSVGTIVGVWDGASALGQSPRDAQVAAVLGVFGPRTTAIVAVRCPELLVDDPVCFEAGLDPASGAWHVVRPSVRLSAPPFKTRYFAPANLRSAAESPAYASLVSRYIADRYTLRYSGGLVPDVVHALVKGHGVYVSPVSARSAAKLRRLYELCPVALILECAGGAAVDPDTGAHVLDAALRDTDERGGLVCGNVDEVDKVKRALRGEQ